MNIETKFNIGDTAFTVDAEAVKVREFVVGCISVYVQNGFQAIMLYPEPDNGEYSGYAEKACFATKEELLNHIMAE